MSLAQFEQELRLARSVIRSAIETKGVPVPPGTTFAGYADLILMIEGGRQPTLQPVTVNGEPVTVNGEPVTVLVYV